MTHCHEQQNLKSTFLTLDPLYDEDALLDLKASRHGLSTSEIDRLPRGVGVQVDLTDKETSEVQIRIMIRFVFGFPESLKVEDGKWTFSGAMDADTLMRHYHQLVALADRADSEQGTARQVFYCLSGHEFESRSLAGATLVEYSDSQLGFRIKDDGMSSEFERWISPSDDAEILERVSALIDDSVFYAEELNSFASSMQSSVETVERVVGMENNGLNLVDVSIGALKYKVVVREDKCPNEKYIKNCLQIRLLYQERVKLKQKLDRAEEIEKGFVEQQLRENKIGLAALVEDNELASVLNCDKATLVELIYTEQDWLEIGVKLKAHEEELEKIRRMAEKRRKAQDSLGNSLPI